MKFKNPYITKIDKIELLEYWIIFQSYLYYEKNTTIVSDDIYNRNTLQLLKYKNKYKKDFKQSKYYMYFNNFESGTGYDLFSLIKRNNDYDLINRILYDSKNFLK